MADPESRYGARYADRAISEYLDRLHAPHDAALERAFRAPESAGLPPIQVGPAEAALLAFLIGLIGARKVVEVGTLAGYSAIRMARALPPDGRLITIEKEPRHAAVARANVAAAGLAGQVEIRQGDGLDEMKRLGPFAPVCAVFIDADKARYPDYLEQALTLLRPGGLLLADNVYLFGRLLDDDAEARAMRRFHEEAARRLETLLVPTPDGMLVGRVTP